MAQIKIDWPAPPVNGAEVKFKAPCDCTAVTGILLAFPAADGSNGSQAFTFRDSHGNDLTGLGNLFSAGALVKVLLDTVRGHAYLQNAATNAYIENSVKKHTHTPASIGAAVPSVAKTVTLTSGGWVSNKQTVNNVSGVTADNHIIVTPAAASYVAYAESMVRCVTQAVGSLTFQCEDVPASNLTVNILIVG